MDLPVPSLRLDAGADAPTIAHTSLAYWRGASERALAARAANVLCVIVGAGHIARADSAAIHLPPPVSACDGQEATIEAWLAGGPVHRADVGPLQFASDGTVAFGTVTLDDSESRLRAAARHAYDIIFRALRDTPCGAPLRFWNFVPRINEEDDGLERYRHFNIGRQEAFLAARQLAFAGAPSACAVGTRAAALTIHFLAARERPLAIENPRQVSAYLYPRAYGPRSPTFSRAALAPLAGQPMLFISGTASIVGHESRHAGDAVAQTVETMANIDALIGQASHVLRDEVRGRNVGRPLRSATAASAANDALAAGGGFARDALDFTIYVRRAEDEAAVRATVTAALGADSRAARRAIYLQADICRHELLVEIEAVGMPLAKQTGNH